MTRWILIGGSGILAIAAMDRGMRAVRVWARRPRSRGMDRLIAVFGFLEPLVLVVVAVPLGIILWVTDWWKEVITR